MEDDTFDELHDDSTTTDFIEFLMREMASSSARGPTRRRSITADSIDIDTGDGDEGDPMSPELPTLTMWSPSLFPAPAYMPSETAPRMRSRSPVASLSLRPPTVRTERAPERTTERAERPERPRLRGLPLLLSTSLPTTTAPTAAPTTNADLNVPARAVPRRHMRFRRRSRNATANTSARPGLVAPTSPPSVPLSPEWPSVEELAQGASRTRASWRAADAASPASPPSAPPPRHAPADRWWRRRELADVAIGAGDGPGPMGRLKNDMHRMFGRFGVCVLERASRIPQLAPSRRAGGTLLTPSSWMRHFMRYMARHMKEDDSAEAAAVFAVLPTCDEAVEALPAHAASGELLVTKVVVELWFHYARGWGLGDAQLTAARAAQRMYTKCDGESVQQATLTLHTMMNARSDAETRQWPVLMLSSRERYIRHFCEVERDLINAHAGQTLFR